MSSMKPIKGFTNYFACPTGKIWATKSQKRPNGCYLKSWKNGKKPYQVVSLYKNNKSKNFLVHRLIAETFIPNPKNLPEVNHIDGDVTNNRLENLEWVTSKQNKKHAWENGLYTHMKLSRNDIKEIRKLYSKGDVYQKELAKKFGVEQAYISSIIRGYTPKHII